MTLPLKLRKESRETFLTPKPPIKVSKTFLQGGYFVIRKGNIKFYYLSQFCLGPWKIRYRCVWAGRRQLSWISSRPRGRSPLGASGPTGTVVLPIVFAFSRAGHATILPWQYSICKKISHQANKKMSYKNHPNFFPK